MKPNPTTLLVEDDRLIRETLSSVLEEDGFRVFAAADGVEALQTLRAEELDLVISDIRMPRMNGFELLAQVRAMPGRREIPFVFLSAMAATSDIRTGMALGADDYITKPFKAEEVCSSLRARLKRADELAEAAKNDRLFLTRYLPHELRTPLTGILGFASLMRDTAAEGRALSKEETAEFGRMIEISGQRLLGAADNLTLLRELGDLLQSGRHLAQDSARGQVWTEATRLLARKTAMIYGREDDLTFDLDPADLRLPGTYLPRVFALLVDNACKFSLPGTPISVRGRIESGKYRLTVSDRGGGMSAEQAAEAGLARQFGREVHEQQGLGLGLEIVQRYGRLAGADPVLAPAEPGPGLIAGYIFYVSS
jgi:two-component system sensor histidine kinase/response regulator